MIILIAGNKLISGDFMLAGVLTVLKIFGIALLCILGLLIFLLLLVLFVPVRYRLDGNIPRMNPDEGFDVEKINVNASFSWLLHIISGGISYPENKEFQIRVFGIKVYPFKEKKNKSDKKSDDKKTSSGVIEMSNMGEQTEKPETGKDADNASKETDESSNVESTVTVNTEIDLNIENLGEENFEKQEAVSDNSGVEETTEKKSDDENPTDKGLGAEKKTDGEKSDDKSFLDVLWNIIDNVSNILKTPQNVFEKIQYTTSRVCGKISMIKTTIENDIFKRAFDLVKSKLIKIIRMILPDKCDVRLNLGTGDPAQTAEMIGIFGALYPFFYNKVCFEPDFDEKVIELDAHLKGHITAFTIVYSAAVCFFNKDVKKVIRRFKKILKS